MASRLVLNELDVNLPTLTAGLVIVIIVVVSSGANARAFDAPVVACTIGISGRVVGGRRVLCIWISYVGHGRNRSPGLCLAVLVNYLR